MNQDRTTPLAFSLRAWPAMVAVAAALFVGTAASAQVPAQPGVVFIQSGDEPAEETEEERKERMRRIAEERRAAALAEREKEKVEAVAAYEAMAKAYLSGRQMDEIDEMYKEMRRHTRYLSREQREAMRHMREMAPTYRPSWWSGTKKQDKNSFEAEIWGRKFWANYVPTRELGLQAVFPKEEFNQRTGEFEVVDLIILVTWKPLMVDSPDPAQGRLAREHKYTLGDIAEIIIWHELGHNYITENLSTRDNIELYEKHDKLYSTLHEYFADMCALYHSTPKGRRIALQFRLDGLDYYTPDQEHCRASHGIGAIVIADMLENPDAWPSVRFPPKVPERQAEVNTIIYIYENLSPDWTVQEDMRLQELAKDYIMKHGERTFRDRGEITLPNKLKYNLMITEDRENQAQRDNWVTGKLDELIKSGRADKIEDVGEYDPPERTRSRRPDFVIQRFDENGKLISGQHDEDAKRLEVPWDQ